MIFKDDKTNFLPLPSYGFIVFSTHQKLSSSPGTFHDTTSLFNFKFHKILLPGPVPFLQWYVGTIPSPRWNMPAGFQVVSLSQGNSFCSSLENWRCDAGPVGMCLLSEFEVQKIKELRVQEVVFWHSYGCIEQWRLLHKIQEQCLNPPQSPQSSWLPWHDTSLAMAYHTALCFHDLKAFYFHPPNSSFSTESHSYFLVEALSLHSVRL